MSLEPVITPDVFVEHAISTVVEVIVNADFRRVVASDRELPDLPKKVNLGQFAGNISRENS